VRALGIDVGVRKRFDLVLLDAERQPVERRRKVEPADLDELIRAWRPDVIAIDAPPQWGTHAGGSRLTERELRRFGIQSFGTPSDQRKAENSFYEWMTVGFAAYEAAARCGYPRYSRGRVMGTAMEVFPHASAVVLHGCLPQRDAKKRTFRTNVLLAQRVSLDGLRSMDQLDAALAALTGLLALDGLCFAPGDPQGGRHRAARPLPSPAALPALPRGVQREGAAAPSGLESLRLWRSDLRAAHGLGIRAGARREAEVRALERCPSRRRCRAGAPAARMGASARDAMSAR
jgi:hypothetical protein